MSGLRVDGRSFLDLAAAKRQGRSSLSLGFPASQQNLLTDPPCGDAARSEIERRLIGDIPALSYCSTLKVSSSPLSSSALSAQMSRELCDGESGHRWAKCGIERSDLVANREKQRLTPVNKAFLLQTQPVDRFALWVFNVDAAIPSARMRNRPWKRRSSCTPASRQRGAEWQPRGDGR